MRHRHLKRAITNWLFLVTLGLIIFFVIFFIRQKASLPKKVLGNWALYPKCEIVRRFSFSEPDALKEWDEKIFKNKVIYKIEKENDLSYVRASSDKSASALYYKINLDARGKRPVMMWRWRVEKFPAKTRPESLETENEDDFAARVYVIFPALFITNSKVLEYVWSETIPVGTTGTSPYSKNIKLIVLEQGLSKEKRWFTEERDIYSDYVKLFGNPPEHNVGAIAFMTNTEHTGTSAEAMYADIETGYNQGAYNKGGGGKLEN
jgi:hypothetical protein